MYLLTAFLRKGLCPHIDNDPGEEWDLTQPPAKIGIK